MKMLSRIGKMMVVLAVVLGAWSSDLAAQNVNPAAMKAFQASSGGAAATWKAGPNSSWEATWLKEGQKMVYCYDNGGVLQQKKIVSNIGAFPASVNASIVAAYPAGKVSNAYKVVDRTNQKFFEVEVANASTVDRMRFSLEGKPMGKTSMAAAQPTGAAATVAVNTKPASSPASPPVAMRGESTSTSSKPSAADDLGDLDDMDDLEDEDLGDLDDLDEEENWDDVNLDDLEDDDSDLLDIGDDLDDDLDIDAIGTDDDDDDL